MYLESYMSRVLDIPKYIIYYYIIVRFIHYKLVSYDKQCLPHSSGEFKCSAMLLYILYRLYYIHV